MINRSESLMPESYVRPMILMVEDDTRITRYLRNSLQQANYDVRVVNDGIRALDEFYAHPIDLVLLDLGLPHLGGMEILERIRQTSNVPVIVLTARDSEADKVRALTQGADDYILKPFGSPELLARIGAVLRRSKMNRPASTTFVEYVNGGLRIDVASRRVMVDNQPIHLTPIEYRLLLLFAENTGKVLTHTHLLSNVWGDEYADDLQILRATIWRLRQKIESDTDTPKYILNEMGVGYRMNDLGAHTE